MCPLQELPPYLRKLGVTFQRGEHHKSLVGVLTTDHTGILVDFLKDNVFLFDKLFEMMECRRVLVLVCAECFCEGGEDKRIPLLKEVFDAFPNTPVNIDIKANNDTLIKKVCVPIFPLSLLKKDQQCLHRCISKAVKTKTKKLPSQVSELVVKYDREHLTVWGNASNKIVKKCYKEVRLHEMLRSLYLQARHFREAVYLKKHFTGNHLGMENKRALYCAITESVMDCWCSTVDYVLDFTRYHL